MIALIACAAAVAGAAPVPRPAPPDEQERLLLRGKKFLKQGKVDLFVAATAAWELKADDLRQWEPAADFGRELIGLAQMTGDRKPQTTPSSFRDFASYLQFCELRFKRVGDTKSG
jgi:hypothetical protein